MKRVVSREFSILRATQDRIRTAVVDDDGTSSMLGGLGRAYLLRPVPGSLWSSPMTLTRFVTKNAFRNKRRSILTVLSIARLPAPAYVHDDALARFCARRRQRRVCATAGGAASRFPDFHLARLLPRKDSRHSRSRLGRAGFVVWRAYTKTRSRTIFSHSSVPIPTNSSRFSATWRCRKISITAWQRDRQGVIVDDTLAKKYGWKLGDRIVLQGRYLSRQSRTVRPRDFPLALPTTSRFTSTPSMWKRPWLSSKGRPAPSAFWRRLPADVSKIASAIDDMFRNSPQPTKSESEKAFGLEFVAMLGNVKAFILSICSAVVFTTLLVSANTMAMSIRERTREVAVLKTLGFTRHGVLGLFVSEAVALSLAGGTSGRESGWVLVYGFAPHGAAHVLSRCE